MKEPEISILLDKYFEGATTIAEEQTLRSYFANDDIPHEWQTFKSLFAFYDKEREVVPPRDERFTFARPARPYKWWLAAASIAAAVALIIVLRSPKPEYTYYVDGIRVYDEAAALAKVENQLQRLSSTMQKAQDGMTGLNRLHEAGQKIDDLNRLPEALRKIEDNFLIKNIN